MGHSRASNDARKYFERWRTSGSTLQGLPNVELTMTPAKRLLPDRVLASSAIARVTVELALSRLR